MRVRPAKRKGLGADRRADHDYPLGRTKSDAARSGRLGQQRHSPAAGCAA